ncbi:hypothetical protein FE257_011672 [Aspergillus nanangensis]|uniref:Aldehyde dehydrogenase domain-containing protein n=1 Tax=Aspergillus nanangensis TaxID=2582783 RepID=A0AAD4CVJ7_ASPNN|nr:hypothetical protein FE257_011672 [Aspergillus nanangensis]
MSLPPTNSNEEIVPLIINGKNYLGQNKFTVTSPEGKPLWVATGASADDATKAVEAAQAALPSWAATKASIRRDIFLKASDLFEKRYDELFQCQKEETGAEDLFIEWILKLTIDNLKEVAGKCSLASGSIPCAPSDGRAALVLREPYGVILGIAPWNAPWPLGVRAFSYALAAGNTCVLKGPEFSPKCYYHIVDIFREAGLPDGVLNLVYHQPQDASLVTTTLIAHPAIKKINFTGSTAVGAIVSATAGKYLKPIITELGGKASLIVLQDADLEKAAKAATMGAFLHAGQVCMSTERIIVHAAVAEAFISLFRASTTAMYGPNAHRPILVSSTGYNKTANLVREAVAQGAKLELGEPPQVLEQGASSSGSLPWMQPVILSNVLPGSDLHEQESFGPTVSVYTFETEAEALRIANDTQYGLSGAVFTRDLAAGLRIAKGYETGAVHINNMTIHDESNLPHGGAKNSGSGRFTGLAGLDEWLRYKVVTYDEDM